MQQLSSQRYRLGCRRDGPAAAAGVRRQCSSSSSSSKNSSSKSTLRAAPCRAVATTDTLQALLSWAESNKIATDKLATSVSLADDRPLLVAARDVQPGEALFTVPEAAWLGAAAVAQSAALGAKVAGFEPWLQLALLLMHERANSGGSGKKVVPAAYMAALQAAPPESPLFWADGDLDELRGTQLLQSLYGYRAYFQQTFADLEANLFAADRATFPAEAFSYDNFLWAAATVRGRARAPLDGAEALALAPLADQLPHARAASCAWRLKPAGLFGRGRALSVEAARAIRKGEELTMDYGPGKLDAAVLLDYGALDADWPQGGYTLTVSIPEGDRYRDDKLDVLERNGVAGGGSGVASFAIKKGEEPSEELLGFLRLAQLSGECVGALRACGRGGLPPRLLVCLSFCAARQPLTICRIAATHHHHQQTNNNYNSRNTDKQAATRSCSSPSSRPTSGRSCASPSRSPTRPPSSAASRAPRATLWPATPPPSRTTSRCCAAARSSSRAAPPRCARASARRRRSTRCWRGSRRARRRCRASSTTRSGA